MNAKMKSTSQIVTNITLTLTEQEAAALAVLPSYGIDNFLKVFYANLGDYYLKPHEAGLRSLLNTIKTEIPPHLKQVEKARQLLKKSNEPQKS